MHAIPFLSRRGLGVSNRPIALKTAVPLVARVLLGCAFFVLGLNGFLRFLPEPSMSGPPAHFMHAMIATGYLFPLVKGTEVLCGVLLLAGRFVPLALALLAPVLVNIVAFHLFLAPSGLLIPLVLVALEIYLAWSFRYAYAPMLRARVIPDGV
jgi:uncharacterized membrane protein YphA (DoxX/SURF4 family)